MSSLLPEDEMLPTGQRGSGPARPGGGPPAGGGGGLTIPSDDAQLLRGLLDDSLAGAGTAPTARPAGTTVGTSAGAASTAYRTPAPASGAGFGLDDARDDNALPLSETHIDDILRAAQQQRASDIHVTVDLPPMYRVDGKLTPSKWEVVTPREAQRLVYDILTSEQIERFERTKELDFSYGVAGIGRYRFNAYRQRGSVGFAMRAIPASIPSLDQLRLPTVLKELTRKHSGLILVTGPTGSGKSTTIASMIDVINQERPVHIMTMEDPIEYLHTHKKAMVNQREIGHDTEGFHNAIRAVLREDPDVILVGEMRDKETIAAALTLAETGHLVFGTLHTRNAPQTIDRVVDVFPPDQQDQIKVQLSNSIEAVIAQQLLPMLGGGRIASIEVMVATSAIRNLIREGKSYQIMSAIETGTQYGMQPMDKVLADMHKAGLISFEEAQMRAIDRENFLRLSRGG
jgi:twitching motility protein PilT